MGLFYKYYKLWSLLWNFFSFYFLQIEIFLIQSQEKLWFFPFGTSELFCCFSSAGITLKLLGIYTAMKCLFSIIEVTILNFSLNLFLPNLPHSNQQLHLPCVGSGQWSRSHFSLFSLTTFSYSIHQQMGIILSTTYLSNPYIYLSSHF